MSRKAHNDLWQAFYAEVSEQLDTLERILTDQHAEKNADIHQLFREFHTIKSSCAMMDFPSMEKVAHASEDFLDLVRKGRATLAKPNILDLLSGIDWLKSQLEITRNTGNAPAENTALIASLRALSERVTADEATDSIDSSESRLSEDEIREFASACQQELLIGLAPDTEPALIKRSLNKLASICNLVGFPQLSVQLKKYIQYRSANDADNIASTTSTIIEQVIAIEKSYRVDCGSSALRPDDAARNLDAIKTGKDTSTSLRVDSHKIDELIKQVRDLNMTYNIMAHALNKNAKTLSAQQDEFAKHHNRMQQILAGIRHRILDLRVLPVSSVFNRIPSLVTKMAETQQKDINLVIKGKDVRIDKGMVDILMEPLIHLVRNCIDHGIELPDERIAHGKPATATLTLSAFQEGSTLTLEISDDGRGINLEKVLSSAIRKGFIKSTEILSDKEICKLIFLPGFSTTDVITETSGRGVGMDVVITRINAIGGDIDVQSAPGQGTCFSMTLPLSAAIQGAVLFTAQQSSLEKRRYAIPQNSVVELVEFVPDKNQEHGTQTSMIYRDEILPLFRLNNLALEAGCNPDQKNIHHGPVIVIGNDSQRIGLHVDSIESREDVFVRELHKDMRTLPVICGATARGNGEVVFILNSKFLLQSAEA
jgi:two-component system chemotaxis sensor kinase CheA